MTILNGLIQLLGIVLVVVGFVAGLAFLGWCLTQIGRGRF